jgi:CRP-like cAMP-binding protein
MVSAEGNRVFLSRESPLSVVGSVEIFSSMPAISTVESLGPSVCLFMPTEAFTQASLRDPALSVLIAKDLADKLVATSESSAAKNAPAVSRIAWYLLGPGTDEVERQSRADMASFLGISERHLNRHLSQLQASDIIEIHPKAILIKRRRDLELLAET